MGCYAVIAALTKFVYDLDLLIAAIIKFVFNRVPTLLDFTPDFVGLCDRAAL